MTITRAAYLAGRQERFWKHSTENGKMKLKLSDRERGLLRVALSAYVKLAESTEKGLEKLNLSTMETQKATGNAEVITVRLDSQEPEIEFAVELRLAVKDALAIAFQKAEKVRTAQVELLIPTQDTVEAEEEFRKLHRRFADQLDLEPVSV